MPEPQILLTGLAIGESPRWHAGRLWFAHWGAREVVAIYLNGPGFEPFREPAQPGFVALVAPDGSVRQVAEGVAFPNGMAVTPDNATLILAESYANRLTAFDITLDAPAPGAGRPSRRPLGEHGVVTRYDRGTLREVRP